jgi:hypothetical protein
MENLMVPTSDWLNTAGAQANTISVNYGNLTGGASNHGLDWYYGNGYFQSGWYQPVYVSSPARPIKLTLSEIERLRKVAKDDQKLKDILNKFTNQIEITVDFS